MASILVCGLGLAPSAHAATLPVLHASRQDAAHTCRALDSQSHAVVCIDIVTGTNVGLPGYWAQGRIELICQGISNDKCYKAQGLFGIFDQASVAADRRFAGSCGGTDPACISGTGQRNFYYTPQVGRDATSATCTDDPNGPNALWAVAFGGVGGTEIWTGSGTGNSLVNNLGTAHYFICP
jgi:hypothetical protein